MNSEERQPARPCPQCQRPLRRLPTLDGGYLLACDGCGYQHAEPPPEPIESAEAPQVEPPTAAIQGPPADATESTQRFRQLTSAGNEAEQAWPQEWLEWLPPDARQRLQKRPTAEKPEPGSTGELSSDWANRLRAQGYLLESDQRGTRLSGQGPRPGTGELTPYDVVRLAADLDGGLPAPESRRKCPHCQAVISIQAETCPWCGKAVGGQPAKPSDEGDPPG